MVWYLLYAHDLDFIHLPGDNMRALRTLRTSCAVALLAVWPAFTQAAPLMLTDAWIMAGTSTPSMLVDDLNTSTSFAQSNAVYSDAVSATNASGDPVTVQRSGSASATATTSSLKAVASVSTIDPVLSSPHFTVGAVSYLQDLISVGASSAAYIKIGLGFSGTLTTMNAASYDLPFEGAAAQLLQSVWSAPGSYDHNTINVFCGTNYWDNCGSMTISTLLLSEAMPVVGGIAVLSFQLAAQAYVNTSDWYMEGGQYGAEADFSHTLEFLDVYAYDVNGVQIDAVSAVGSDGHRYSVASVPAGNNVPEPQPLLLVCTALACLAGVRRYKSLAQGGH